MKGSFGESNVPAGHSTNGANLYRYVAFTAYSTDDPCANTPVHASIEMHARNPNTSPRTARAKRHSRAMVKSSTERRRRRCAESPGSAARSLRHAAHTAG